MLVDHPGTVVAESTINDFDESQTRIKQNECLKRKLVPDESFEDIGILVLVTLEDLIEVLAVADDTFQFRSEIVLSSLDATFPSKINVIGVTTKEETDPHAFFRFDQVGDNEIFEFLLRLELSPQAVIPMTLVLPLLFVSLEFESNLAMVGKVVVVDLKEVVVESDEQFASFVPNHSFSERQLGRFGKHVPGFVLGSQLFFDSGIEVGCGEIWIDL